jgi:surfeit locus 1 family protein
MVVEPRVREGIHGAHVITPMVRKDGTTILVDRGFVSEDVFQEGSFERPDGEVEVFGLLRTAPRHNAFTPKNVPDEKKWYWVEVDAMATYAGENAQPVLVEEIFGKS